LVSGILRFGKDINDEELQRCHTNLG
jgi:hypothetical protein